MSPQPAGVARVPADASDIGTTGEACQTDTGLMPEVSIRRAQRGDESELQANCKPAVSVEQVRRQLDWTARERAPHSLEHLVAMVQDEVVGTVMLTP